jgi:D-lactate dehydrogenase, membrane binding
MTRPNDTSSASKRAYLEFPIEFLDDDWRARSAAIEAAGEGRTVYSAAWVDQIVALRSLPPSGGCSASSRGTSLQGGVRAFLGSYRAIHRREVEDMIALDVALRRNDLNWVETLPDDVAKPIIHKLYYGHFFCHVFHQDYIVRKGHDELELEHRIWKLLDARGAEYPAEHNVGHLYRAKPALIDLYRSLDPCTTAEKGLR